MNTNERKCFICAPSAHYSLLMFFFYLRVFAFICGQYAFDCARDDRIQVNTSGHPYAI